MKIPRLSKNLNQTLKLSIEIARRINSFQVDEDILFVSLLSQTDSAAVRTLRELDIDVDATISNILYKISPDMDSSNILNINDIVEPDFQVDISPLYKVILEDSYKVAINMMAPYVGTEHLLIAWYENVENEIKEALIQKGISQSILYNTIKNAIKYPIFNEAKESPDRSSILKIIGKDLTEMARNNLLDPVVGREEETNRLASILMRRTKNNPILIGDAGVGKTAIVEGFAQKVVNNELPAFANKNIWQIDTATLLAGSPMRGDIESKLLALIEEVSNDNSIMLFIDEIHTIMSSAQSGGGSDIVNVLKPALAKGQLRCIGATTYAEYVKYIESDPALARRFQPVFVEEISADNAKLIINQIKPTLQNYHRISIDNKIVEEAVELSERYITDRFLPDKALDLLDEASAAKNLKTSSFPIINNLEELESSQNTYIEEGNIKEAAKIRNAIRNLEKTISKGNSVSSYKSLSSKDIKNVVSQWTGIPIVSLSTTNIKKIKLLPKTLSKRIVGQENAVDLVSKALQVAKVGIADENRPMGSFIFAGPTGVGKTELAKQIARIVFGSKDNLVQLDMSEMMEAHSISKLIGSPPGYIGFDMGGQLTERIRKRPYCVVLFDEIEKAHPDVLNVLLQILEEGKITDSKGRVANFKNSIVIMTTNLGADAIINSQSLGLKIKRFDEEKAYEEMESTVVESLRNYLRPEFFNRIDYTVVFRPLDIGDVEKITEIQLNELSVRLKKYKKIQLSYTNKLIKYIAKNGFDKEYGARNIRRFINEKVEGEISRYILDDNLSVKSIALDINRNQISVN